MVAASFYSRTQSGLFSATTGGSVTPIATPPNFSFANTFAVTVRVIATSASRRTALRRSLPRFRRVRAPSPRRKPFLTDSFQRAYRPTEALPRRPFAFADDNDGDIAVGDAASLGHIALANAGTGACYATFFDANGDAWGACSNGTTTQLEHIIRASMWTAIVPPNIHIFQGSAMPIAIVERGYSGPFTATVSDPTTVAVNTPPPGYEHTIPLTFNTTGPGSVTLTISDAHGVSQTFPVSWTYSAPLSTETRFSETASSPALGLTQRGSTW